MDALRVFQAALPIIGPQQHVLQRVIAPFQALQAAVSALLLGTWATLRATYMVLTGAGAQCVGCLGATAHTLTS